MNYRSIILSALLIISFSAFSINPFYSLGTINKPANEAIEQINTFLESNAYTILGTYPVGNNPNQQVLVFTNNKIKSIALSYPNRGGLAIAQKFGFITRNGKTEVSLLNPDYLFRAYFQDDYEKNTDQLKKITHNLISKLKAQGFSLKPFGGDVDVNDLEDYQYMIGMPEFDDPVTLRKFDSFDAGVKTIEKNLQAKVGETKKVYEIIDTQKQIAVFGVALLDAENGEKSFLSIIGATHLAAMPYEIILQGNKATMLHGRFRFALYWPELSMSTFTKIMSTPGYVEETLEKITK